jgi:hypothetical protein
MKLSERFTGELGVQITSEVTSVKDEIREWTGVFHNHSSIYTMQKRLYKDDIYTEYQKRLYKDDIYITKTTCTTLERLRHIRRPQISLKKEIGITGWWAGLAVRP